MGRQLILVTALLLLIREPGLAQGHRAGGRGRPNQLHPSPSGNGPHFSSEDRQAFRRNAERWLKMDAQQQQLMRERERQVLEQRFGLVDGYSRTLEEVGRQFRVTRERIRQIEAKALRKMRHPTRIRQLEGFLEAAET